MKTPFLITAALMFLAGLGHLAIGLTSSPLMGLYSRLPGLLRDLLWAHALEVHRLWWGAAVASCITALARREPGRAMAVSLLAVVVLLWLGWESVLLLRGVL